MFTSSPYQYPEGYAGCQNLSRCHSHEQMIPDPGHGPFYEQLSSHTFGQETSINPFLSTPMNDFDPWMLEGPPCASPMSKSSSTSHTESVSTPPYTGLPIYGAVQPAFHHVDDSPAGQNVWANEFESLWRPSYPEPTAWDSQTFVLPCHGVSAYQQHSLQPPPSFPTQPNSTHYMAYHTSVQNMDHPTAQPVGSESIKVEHFSNREDNSDGQSDSELELSDSDDDRSSNEGAPGKSNVSRLKDLTGTLDPIHITLSQHAFKCPLVHKSRKQGQCGQQFKRPKDLSRHMRTVHTDVRNYICLVPGCHRPFSRSDHLHAHYRTHLSCGSRKCQNKKMSFEEIEEILGPEQKLLIGQLKMKLNNQKQKNGMKAEMKQRRFQKFPLSPHQYIGDGAGSLDLSRCTSHQQVASELGHNSFDDRVPFHDDCSSNKCSSLNSKGVQITSNNLTLGNFPGILNNMPTTPSDRPYECSLVFESKAEGKCGKRFDDPELLRRHINTVHTDVRDYICLVPGCKWAFPRSDNLFAHYRTHLSRGGKKSKNRKISFEEIEEILGPEQNLLLERLKMKLNN